MAGRLSLLRQTPPPPALCVPGRTGHAPRRLLALLLLTIGVLLLHSCVVDGLAQRMQDAGESANMPARMAVSYVRELALAEPPATAVVAAPSRAPTVRRAAASQSAAAPAPAASAARTDAEPETVTVSDAQAEPVTPTVPDPVLAAAPPAMPASAVNESDAVPAAAHAAASVASAAVAPAVSGEVFQWPPSTRTSYVLKGNYRGPVEGVAQVEWVHAGPRYQVHLDVSIGGPMPLMGRRMSSEGRLTDRGLVPERYDEETTRLFSQGRRNTLRFEGDTVRLSDGSRVPAPGATQDAVSQFVQLSFLFATQPALLQPGATLAMRLALPRRVGEWVYQVLPPERQHTPFGELETLHLKPRLEDRHAGELSAEVWLAPRLRYLPVRIRIEQGADTWIDLTIDRLPQLGEAGPASGATGPAPPEASRPAAPGGG